VLDQGQRLELLHTTQVEGIPGALVAFKGRLLAGVGPVLRLYELGKKKLLRKCEYKQLPQHVAQLTVLGSRIFVGDVQVGSGVWGCVAGAWVCRLGLKSVDV
jgi:splicing factor 3B subunit 3